jgi:hypothetical protein
VHDGFGEVEEINNRIREGLNKGFDATDAANREVVPDDTYCGC